MSISGLQTKFQKIIENNPELVASYDSLGTNAPLEYSFDEIEVAFNNLKSIDKTADFSIIFKSALQNSVKYEQNIVDSINSITSEAEESTQNSIQQYFKEVGTIYARHNNDYNIEFCPENRDKLIEMNLKAVISIAKRYQGLGLSLQELISAGNLGLCIAFDKFDPNRSKLKDHVLECIEPLSEEISFEELSFAVKNYLTYGDIKKKFFEKFTTGNVYNKKDVIKWVNRNIFNAKFNSIATMWIRAYILIEIDNYSRLVKKPKAYIYKDKVESGSYKKEITIDIDSPISSEGNITVGDTLCLKDETENDFEVSEAYITFKNELAKLLKGVKPRDRSIFLKKFGIGLPRPMLPKEIAEQEGLSKARVSQIFQTVLEQMQENSVKYNVDPSILFSAVRKFK
jgi:RNA polymerase sigma factor (sigma-70 family)